MSCVGRVRLWRSGVNVLGVQPAVEPVVRADIWGPVEIDSESVWFCGATKGTNNTSEINGIGQDVDEVVDTLVVMMIDR